MNGIVLEYDQLIAEETIGDFGNRKRLDERIAAIKEIQDAGAHYSEDKYALSDIAIVELQKIFCSPEPYKKFYGNQLQHLIHRDCIAILEETIILPESSPIFAYKNAFIECIDSAREFNQEGSCRKAITITDFCWSFLDYGKAIIEGATNGLLGVAQHCYEHPIQTAACVIVPEVIFVYQLGKLLYDVVDIGSTALSGETVSQETVRAPNELISDGANLGLAALSYKIPSARGLHTLIAPVTHVMDLLQSGECTGPKIVKGVTQCAVSFQAQKKLFGGLGKLFNTAKAKALDFIEKNPSADPEQYMATPEGVVIRAVSKLSGKQKNSIEKVRGPARGTPNNSKKISEAKNIPAEKPVEWTRHGGKHVPPKNVPWKDIVKSTLHGGHAKYAPNIKIIGRYFSIKELEYYAWQNGKIVISKNGWKVLRCDSVIGAFDGEETRCIVVKCSGNIIHGHPISEEKYLRYFNEWKK